MNIVILLVPGLTQFLFAFSFQVKEASFTLPKIGLKLKGKELKTKHTKSTLFCANDCVRLEECSAYNYDERNGICQLMETNDLSMVEPHPHYQIVLKKITCKAEPCMYGGICYDVATPVHDARGFRCSCPCGRCGGRCGKLHFGFMENACIYLFNAGYKRVKTPDECMAFCWDTQGCKSADFFRGNGDCWLNSVTSDEEPLTLDCDDRYPGVAYLFFNCTCNE